jgi:hypothetical protein
MKKTYVFEYVEREEIEAYSEEEARAVLEERGCLVDEFELIDVWSAEEPNVKS